MMGGYFRTLAAGLGLALMASAGVAEADNQTPTTSPITVGGKSLPYSLTLERVDTRGRLPTLQAYAEGTYNGLWVLIGGRTNGLHDFTDDPLQNFPPSQQNNRIWVVDPSTWKVWSRAVTGAGITVNQADQLSATNFQWVQTGDTLYVVGGYGYSRTRKNFTTYNVMIALDLPKVIDWVREPAKSPPLASIIRQAQNGNFQVTGGQMTMLGNRAYLAFGHDFDGGYLDPSAVQTYTGQVRSFDIVDNGKQLGIANVRHMPHNPDLVNFRRRDYTLAQVLDGNQDVAVALAGVFTATDGVFTVPVELRDGRYPYQPDPAAPTTFKQGMNGYDTATLTIWDKATGSSHIILFGGISYVTYDPATKKFVADSNVPFTSQVTAIVRDKQDQYRQYLLETTFPKVSGPDVASYLFGAEAKVFLAPGVPTRGKELIDLDALRHRPGQAQAIGWIYGGIAAAQANFGASVASNEVFRIVLTEK
jgi:hypothetical protein